MGSRAQGSSKAGSANAVAGAMFMGATAGSTVVLVKVGTGFMLGPARPARGGHSETVTGDDVA